MKEKNEAIKERTKSVDLSRNNFESSKQNRNNTRAIQKAKAFSVKV